MMKVVRLTPYPVLRPPTLDLLRKPPECTELFMQHCMCYSATCCLTASWQPPGSDSTHCIELQAAAALLAMW